jgi:hypothetical protein
VDDVVVVIHHLTGRGRPSFQLRSRIGGLSH